MHTSRRVAPHPRSTMRSSMLCLTDGCVGAPLVLVKERAWWEAPAASGAAVRCCSVSPASSGALMLVSIELDRVMKPGSNL
jgi:hypothetical protein